MGDRALLLSELVGKEEKYRRKYYCGRFGTNVTQFLDDPFWTPWNSNDKVAPLHDHLTPYALMQPNYGLKQYREARAAAAAAAAGNDTREKTPVPSVQPAVPSEQRHPAVNARPAPATPSSAQKLTGAQNESDADGSGGNYLTLADGQLPRSASASLPSRGPSRRSASVGGPPLGSSYSRRSGSDAHASRLSRRTHESMASLRSKIGEAVQREVKTALKRSELDALMEAKAAKIVRDRQKVLDMPIHLRPGVNPINNGCPIKYETATMACLQLPIKMATDPKWSTDLKKMNNKIGMRLEWEKKMSASLSGSISPEMKYMPPKDYVTNPPTPHFVPGKAHEARGPLNRCSSGPLKFAGPVSV